MTYPTVPLLQELKDFINAGIVNDEGSFTPDRKIMNSPHRNNNNIQKPSSPKTANIATDKLSPKKENKPAVEKPKRKIITLLSPRSMKSANNTEWHNGQNQLALLLTANDTDLIAENQLTGQQIISPREKKSDEICMANNLFLKAKLIRQNSRERDVHRQNQDISPQHIRKQNQKQQSSAVDPTLQKTKIGLTEKQKKTCIEHILKTTFDDDLKVIADLEYSPQSIWETLLNSALKKKAKKFPAECPEELKEPLRRIITMHQLMTTGIECVSQTILSFADIRQGLTYLCDQIFDGSAETYKSVEKTPQEIWTNRLKPYFENLSDGHPLPENCPKEIVEQLEKFIHYCLNSQEINAKTKPDPKVFFTAAHTQVLRGISYQEKIEINGIEFSKKLDPIEVLNYDETVPRNLEKVPESISSFYLRLIQTISKEASWNLDVPRTLQNLLNQEPTLEDRNLLNVFTLINMGGWGKWHPTVQISLLSPIFYHPWKTIHLRQIEDKGDEFIGVPNATTCKLAINEEVIVTLNRKFQTRRFDDKIQTKPVFNFSITVDCHPSKAIGMPDTGKIKLTDLAWAPEATKNDKKALKKIFF